MPPCKWRGGNALWLLFSSKCLNLPHYFPQHFLNLLENTHFPFKILWKKASEWNSVSCWVPAWYNPQLKWSLLSSGEETTNEWTANWLSCSDRRYREKIKQVNGEWQTWIWWMWSEEASLRNPMREGGRELHSLRSKVKAWDGNVFVMLEEHKASCVGRKWGLNVYDIAWCRERECMWWKEHGLWSHAVGQTRPSLGSPVTADKWLQIWVSVSLFSKWR